PRRGASAAARDGRDRARPQRCDERAPEGTVARREAVWARQRLYSRRARRAAARRRTASVGERRRPDSNRGMEVLQTSPLTTWVPRPADGLTYWRDAGVSTRGARIVLRRDVRARQRGVPVGGGPPTGSPAACLRFSSFFWRFSSAFIRRSAS